MSSCVIESIIIQNRIQHRDCVTDLHDCTFSREMAFIMNPPEFMAVVLILSIYWAGKNMILLLQTLSKKDKQHAVNIEASNMIVCRLRQSNTEMDPQTDLYILRLQ